MVSVLGRKGEVELDVVALAKVPRLTVRGMLTALVAGDVPVPELSGRVVQVSDQLTLVHSNLECTVELGVGSGVGETWLCGCAVCGNTATIAQLVRLAEAYSRAVMQLEWTLYDDGHEGANERLQARLDAHPDWAGSSQLGMRGRRNLLEQSKNANLLSEEAVNGLEAQYRDCARELLGEGRECNGDGGWVVAALVALRGMYPTSEAALYTPRIVVGGDDNEYCVIELPGPLADELVSEAKHGGIWVVDETCEAAALARNETSWSLVGELLSNSENGVLSLSDAVAAVDKLGV
jgi:hypothetical protein